MSLLVFQHFPKEGELVGKLLSAYTDLEFMLLLCADGVRNDFDTLLKAMYRSRGETQRIDIADAFGRLQYKVISLDTQFGMAVGAIRYCLKIRNQYSHCHWFDDNGRLAFVNLEEIAKQNEKADIQYLTTHYLSPELLQLQDDYYLYTNNLMTWLGHEARLRTKKTQLNPFPVPAQLTQPALYIP